MTPFDSLEEFFKFWWNSFIHSCEQFPQFIKTIFFLFLFQDLRSADYRARLANIGVIPLRGRFVIGHDEIKQIAAIIEPKCHKGVKRDQNSDPASPRCKRSLHFTGGYGIKWSSQSAWTRSSIRSVSCLHQTWTCVKVICVARLWDVWVSLLYYLLDTWLLQLINNVVSFSCQRIIRIQSILFIPTGSPATCPLPIQ
jgi:hypothetical protein